METEGHDCLKTNKQTMTDSSVDCDSDEDDDVKLLFWNGWPATIHWALFPVGSIVGGSLPGILLVRFEIAQNLSFDSVEWNYAEVITTTPLCNSNW